MEILAECSVEVCESGQPQLIASARSVLFQQRLRDWKAVRLSKSCGKRHWVKGVCVTIHQCVRGGTSVIRSVQQEVIDRNLSPSIGCAVCERCSSRPTAQRNRCGQNASRQARLRRENAALGPSVEYIFPPAVEALGKRNLIRIAQHEAIPDIELGIGTLEVKWLRRVQGERAVVDQHSQSIGNVIDTMRPGVVSVEGQSVLEPANALHLQ